jgi:muramoyltetrapeptide carboxypeptidase
VVPVALARGSRVAIVAPASPFPPADLEAGVAWLRERYRVELGEHLHARSGYLAGSDEQRAEDLQRALDDADVRAIFCARGGYGILRLLERLSWDGFLRSPKWICGFSDVTALHVAAADAGVASLHAHNLTGLGRASAEERRAVLDFLEADASGLKLQWRDLSRVHGSEQEVVRGPLFGGNVALLHALAAARRLRVPPGAILLLEDVGERPYRLDRMLVGLRLGGHLAQAAAVVLGEFRDCGPGADGITAAEVLAAETSALGIPVWQHAPFGHGAINHPFPLGLQAELGAGTLRVGEGKG